MIILGLVGMAFCSYKTYDALRGGGRIPLGKIIGGAWFGWIGFIIGAKIGADLLGDDIKTKKPKKNWNEFVFWIILDIICLVICIWGFIPE